VVAVAEW